MAIRQNLTLVALGKRPADRVVEVGRLLAVHANHWLDDQEIVIAGRRIAYVGPAGSWRGEAGERIRYPHLSAVPGFGEVHKHIESTHLTPEFEAALVLPRGNTWTCEASHEFANVNGAQEHRVLAEGAACRLAAEDLHPAGLRGAAERLGGERRLVRL